MQKDDQQPAAGEGAEAGRGLSDDRPVPAQRPVGIVDDDEPMVDSLGLLLAANGFEVIAHSSGPALLDDERRRLIGCLVIDQHMPAMDGLTVIAALNRENLSIPTVLVTGRLDSGVAERAGALGVTILEKPFPAARLLDLIRAGLGRGR